MKEHTYKTTIRWTGNTGSGTSAYRSYARSHLIQTDHKPAIPGSSDPDFLGDGSVYNPEELLVASLAACHMLWYLHLCAEGGVIVTAYEDDAAGMMAQDPAGGGRFTRVVLHPVVTIQDPSMADRSIAFHEKARQLCFIANSVNFPVDCEPVYQITPS